MIMLIGLSLVVGTSFGVFLMALMGSARARDEMEVSLDLH